MTYGFFTNNSFGGRQVDETYKAWSLYKKATVTVSSAGGVSPVQPSGWIEDLPAGTLVNPVVFLRNTNGVPATMWYGGGSTTAFRMNIACGSSFTGAPNYSVTYYIFSQDLPATNTFGVSVFNAAGQRTYSSDWRVMRLGGSPQQMPTDTRTVFPNPPAPGTYSSTSPYNTYSATAPYTATWAAAYNGGRYMNVENGKTSSGYVDGIYISGNVCSIAPRLTPFPSTGSDYNVTGPTIIFADVTNY